MVDDPLLTCEEAARELRVSPSTVTRERVEGRLGFVPIRGRYFYRMSQIHDYILSRSVRPCQTTTSSNVPSPPTGTLPGPKEGVAAAFQQARRIAHKLNLSKRRSS